MAEKMAYQMAYFRFRVRLDFQTWPHRRARELQAFHLLDDPNFDGAVLFQGRAPFG